MPVNSVVVSLVIRVVERTNLCLCTDRRAESGAVVILTGAAVKVAHCHSSQFFPKDTVVDGRERWPTPWPPALARALEALAVITPPLVAARHAGSTAGSARDVAAGLHWVLRVQEVAGCLARESPLAYRGVWIVVQDIS
jgi:hypothetical protein